MIFFLVIFCKKMFLGQSDYRHGPVESKYQELRLHVSPDDDGWTYIIHVGESDIFTSMREAGRDYDDDGTVPLWLFGAKKSQLSRMMQVSAVQQ